ncbi:hypothetical protein ACFE04_012473 [Oxalis oulophora]
MATAPVKSQQPLHNFSFPFLKWNTTTHDAAAAGASATTNSATTAEPPDNNNNNNNNAAVSETDHSRRIRVTTRVGSRSSRPHRSSFASFLQKPNLNQNDDDEDEQEEEEEKIEKPWNLRPRKNNNHHGCGGDAVVALPVVSGGGRESNGRQQHQQRDHSMMRLRGSNNHITEEEKAAAAAAKEVMNNSKKSKTLTKFWISLSKEEIEEDVFIMTGNRPARRPKKRPKNVQKQLDFVFPGLWLVGTTVDSYRVNDPPVKERSLVLVYLLLVESLTVCWLCVMFSGIVYMVALGAEYQRIIMSSNGQLGVGLRRDNVAASAWVVFRVTSLFDKVYYVFMGFSCFLLVVPDIIHPML